MDIVLQEKLAAILNLPPNQKGTATMTLRVYPSESMKRSGGSSPKPARFSATPACLSAP